MFSFTPYIVSVCFPFSLGEGFLQNVQGSLETAHIKDTKCWAKPVGRLELSTTSESQHWRETSSKQAFLLGGLNNSVAWRLFSRVSFSKQSLQCPSWEPGCGCSANKGGRSVPSPRHPFLSGQPPSAAAFPSSKACKKSPISYKDFTLILFILMGFFFFFTFFFLISRGKQINMI